MCYLFLHIVELYARPPPPEPPFPLAAQSIPEPLPPPPPVDVIVENTEFEPFELVDELPGKDDVPPAPTVTGYVCSETGKAATQAPNGLTV